MGDAVGPWIERSVTDVAQAWGGLEPGTESELLHEAAKLGANVAREVESALEALALSDVDSQTTTPLSVVRAATAAPTALLRAVGVPPIERDVFSIERFPDDIYGLVPPSLGAIDPSLNELAITWGAAKAAVHRRRHGSR
ncbi:MAG TPA: hypothetical protein VEJ87_08450 [Acidimicrobiales bacterium]|nr:hypothetical protein [Acidimicrobiales bacterium]